MTADSNAREQALDPRRSFIVQAPAGSGKTGLLVYRYLNLLTQVDKPENVLAITFTRKARAEMLERVLELLLAAQSQQAPKDDYESVGLDLAARVLVRDEQRQWSILTAPQQLQILTIDAFSGRLAGSMPWLSRLGDRPRTTDQADAHYAVATDQVLDELLNFESELHEPLKLVLQELDFNYSKARKLFNAMLAKRDQWLRHLVSQDLNRLRTDLQDAWQTLFTEAKQRLLSQCSEGRLQSVLELAVHAANELDFTNNLKAEKSMQALAGYDSGLANLKLAHWQGIGDFLLTKQNTPRKQLNKNIGVSTNTEANKAHKSQTLAVLADISEDAQFIEGLVNLKDLPSTTFNDADWTIMVALEKVLKALAVRLQLRFRSVGEFDHSEVTQRANLALSELNNPTDLGLQMDGQIQHILVDEFQDTSTAQISLLQKLTAGWQLEEGESRTLFLVGDPMQSIYRFREADVSLFLQVVNNAKTGLFNNIDITPLSLTQNFRSTSALVEWFNDTFGQSFAASNDVLTGRITYANAASNKRSDDDSVVDYWLAEDKAAEAALCLKSVQTALNSLTDPDAKVAILVRSRTHLDHLLPTLDHAGIDYVAVDIQPLSEQQAMQDIVALAKCLCREDDRIAWLAMLRGPWCGLTLAEIHMLCGDSSRTIWQALHDAENVARMSDSSRSRLQRFVDIMERSLSQHQQVDVGSLTRWSWRLLGGPETLGSTQLNDAEQLFELLNRCQRGGDIVSDAELNVALESMRASTSTDASARVVISTAHKAKGLQYHTVILPGLGSQGRSDDKDIMMWAEFQSLSGDNKLLLAPLVFNPTGDSKSQSTHYDYLRQLEKQRAANEMIRLMYVACTRAEKKLVLIARLDRDGDERLDQPKAPAKSALLSTIWEATNAQFKYPIIDVDHRGSTEDDAQTSRALEQTLVRLPDDFSATLAPNFEWQPIRSKQVSEEEKQANIDYDWATQVATAVGIILHEFLQFSGTAILTCEINQSRRQRWRQELTALSVPDDRIDYALRRLVSAVQNIQMDTRAHFIFRDYPIAENEYAISTVESGIVRQYRIDRTFVDQQGTRWIVDYKSTVTRSDNIEAFIDQQIALRHRPQLQKYGALMSQLDGRPIKLAVYFPLLKVLRTWTYQADLTSEP